MKYEDGYRPIGDGLINIKPTYKRKNGNFEKNLQVVQEIYSLSNPTQLKSNQAQISSIKKKQK